MIPHNITRINQCFVCYDNNKYNQRQWKEEEILFKGNCNHVTIDEFEKEGMDISQKTKLVFCSTVKR